MAGSLEMLLHDAKLLRAGHDDRYMLLENMGDVKEAIIDTADEIEQLQSRLDRRNKTVDQQRAKLEAVEDVLASGKGLPDGCPDTYAERSGAALGLLRSPQIKDTTNEQAETKGGNDSE